MDSIQCKFLEPDKWGKIPINVLALSKGTLTMAFRGFRLFPIVHYDCPLARFSVGGEMEKEKKNDYVFSLPHLHLLLT